MPTPPRPATAPASSAGAVLLLRRPDGSLAGVLPAPLQAADLLGLALDLDAADPLLPVKVGEVWRLAALRSVRQDRQKVELLPLATQAPVSLHPQAPTALLLEAASWELIDAGWVIEPAG